MLRNVSIPTVLWLAFTSALTAAEPIGRDQFEKLHTLIKPQPDERKWEGLPWMTNLWEARRLGAKLGKPIVLWERDGLPLGCV